MSVKSLPSIPNIEFLKKEAKTLLADAKTGDSSALARLGKYVPTFGRDIPKLSLAQFVLAREYGFSSWETLREAVIKTTSSTLAKAMLNLKKGEMCILFDDETRENEGDFVVSAEKVTPEQLNFISKQGRGTLCVAISNEIAERFGLKSAKTERSPAEVPSFAQSFDAKSTTTGVSTADRALSIKMLMDDSAEGDDLRIPGHTLPLIEHPGRLSARRGHTEGSLDLVRRAGLKAGAVICEIMNDDGTMARLHDLRRIAEKHRLPLVRISELLALSTENQQPRAML